MARETLFHRIGGEGGHSAARSGKDADEKTDDGPSDNRPEALLPVLSAGQQSLDVLLIYVSAQVFSQVVQHLSDAEHTHGDGYQSQTIAQSEAAVRKALLPGDRIRTDGAEQKSEDSHEERFEHRAAGEIGNQSEAEKRQRKIFRRPEAQRGCAEDRGEKHQPHKPESSGNEGAQSRDSQSRAGAPLTGHLITIETGNYGSRLARNIDQHRRRGAAVHR